MRKKNIVIGYTTGVFDMFHIGHLNILMNAKKHCDYLIVGVTTDEEVLRIKKRMPIIPFEQRMQIVSAIKYVDLAVPEDNVDKLVNWEKYKFNVIFKGDDWKGSELWNHYENEFEKLGVKVIYFPYTKDISTTELINKIKEQKIL